jgi:hypothetical protein
MTKIKVVLDEIHMCKIPEYDPNSYVILSQITMDGICDVNDVSQILGPNHEKKEDLCSLYIYGTHRQEYKFIELFVRHMIRYKLKFDRQKLKIKPNVCIKFPGEPDITELYLDDSVQCSSITITFKYVNELGRKYFPTTIDKFFMSGQYFVCVGKSQKQITKTLDTFNIKYSDEQYEKLGTTFGVSGCPECSRTSSSRSCAYLAFAMIWNNYEHIMIPFNELYDHIRTGEYDDRLIRIYLFQ